MARTGGGARPASAPCHSRRQRRYQLWPGRKDGLEQPVHPAHRVRERARAGRQSAGQRGRRLQDRHEGPGRRSHQHRHLLGRRGGARWTRPGATWTSAASSTAAWRNSRRCNSLADMATHLVAARQMVRLAACKLDGGAPGAPPAAPWPALRDRHGLPDLPGCATDTRRLRLPAGLSLGRLVRDTRVHQILEGTNEIMRVIIARQLLEKGADIR